MTLSDSDFGESDHVEMHHMASAQSSLGFTTNQRVCIKQLYRERQGNVGIARLDGRQELAEFIKECNRIQWAMILLDLTYQFVARKTARRGYPKDPIPNLHFTRVAIAIVQTGVSKDKVYMIEEFIETDEGNGEPQFRKYINNQHPTSCVPLSAPSEAHNIAAFLVFFSTRSMGED